MKNLVVYYTWMGNTEVVAKEIHQFTGGDLLKLEEVRERPVKGLGTAAFGALLGVKSRLKPFDFSLKDYDNIFLGAQIWAGRTTPAINTFLKKADLRNKSVYLFVTKSDPKVPQTFIDTLTRRIGYRGGRVLSSLSITTEYKKLVAPEELNESVSNWIKSLNI